MHQITLFLIIFSGEHATNPLAKRMEQHANLKSKNRPQANPGYAPVDIL